MDNVWGNNVHKWSRLRTGIAALLALALVAAACGGDDDDTDDGAVDAAADIDPAGVLRLGADLTLPQSGQFDPISVDVLLSTTHEFLYGTLYRMTPEGEAEPDLAEEVTIVDSSTLTVELRDGLTFTDDTPLDAEALKFSWERALQQSKAGGLEAEFREIESLTVTSPLVLTVKLKQPIAGAFFRLLRLAETSPVSPTAVRAGVDFNKTPVGAGPFKLVSYQPGVATRFEKNPDYWNADAIKIAGIEYVNVTAQALTNAVRSSTIDFASLNAVQARELQQVPGYAIENEPSNDINLLGFWCKSKPPFDNLKVRQAINYGNDKDEINVAAYDGKGEEMAGFHSSVSPFYNEDLKGYYEYDPDKAKELLAEAGVPNLAFDMFFQPGDGQIATEVMQAQLARIGVKVTLKALANVTDFFPNATGAPIFVAPLPRSGIQKVTRLLVPGSFGNVCNWDDPELTGMARRLQGIDETSAEGVELWHKLSENLMENALHLLGVWGTSGYTYNEGRLGGIELYDGRSSRTLDIQKVFVKK
ncbi:MAG: ABC transporter substrate-binding protein [Acidimicrobiia bacterium]